MPQPRFARKPVLYKVITVCLVLVTIELGLHLIDWAAHRARKTPGRIPFHGRYEGQEFVSTLARESDGRSQEYHQYLTWISRPQKGQFVNLDNKTGRKTWNPPTLKDPGVAVWVFGGSAAWGYGARDDYTIPSQLSRRLNARDVHFRVFNFAEPGYTFTQGISYLITKLRDGSRPTYIIFYDGFNDVYGAYQSGKAGTLHNVAQVKEKLESKPRQLYWKSVKKWLEQNIYLYGRVFSLARRRSGERFREVGAKFDDKQLKTLAAELVQYYFQSKELLDRLSRAYGFKYVCFWQPALFTEARILPQEKRADERLEDKNFAKLYKFANRHLEQNPLPPHFYNLTDVIGQRTKPCYIDLVHLTEEGYGMVADRIYSVLKQEFSLGD